MADGNGGSYDDIINFSLSRYFIEKSQIIRQHFRLSICFHFFELDKSETNPNNNLMMRRAGLSNVGERGSSEWQQEGIPDALAQGQRI